MNQTTNLPTVVDASIVMTDGPMMMPRDAVQAMMLAKDLAQARLVPQAFQKSPADVFMAMSFVRHFGLEFFMAIQHISVIRGRLFCSGQLTAAMLFASGALAERLSYEYSGAGDERTVKVSARLVNESEPRSIEVRLKDVRTPGNENWIKQPDQQLAYSGARIWGRRHTPDVLLGIMFEGETIEVTPNREIEVRVGQTPTLHPSMSQAERTDAVSRDMSDGEVVTGTRAADEERVPTVDPSEAERAGTEPIKLGRTGNTLEAWSAWATLLMAYVRAAPDADTINAWRTANSEALAELQVFDPKRHKRLIDMIEHQLAMRSEQGA